MKIGFIGVGPASSPPQNSPKSAVTLLPVSLGGERTSAATSCLGHCAQRKRLCAFIAWLRMPSSALMMVLLLVILFYHSPLGVRMAPQL
jgi:hypothetical protein